MYFKKVLLVKNIVKINKIKEGDILLLKILKDSSKKLFDKFEKEIDSKFVKENLSPNVSSVTSNLNLDKLSIEKNTAKVK